MNSCRRRRARGWIVIAISLLPERWKYKYKVSIPMFYSFVWKTVNGYIHDHPVKKLGSNKVWKIYLSVQRSKTFCLSLNVCAVVYRRWLQFNK